MKPLEMSARFVYRITMLAVVLLSCASMAKAQEAYPVSYNDLVRRIEQIEVQSAHYGPGVVADTCGCEDVGCSDCGCCECCCSPTFYAGAELPWLQVQSSGIAIPGIPIMTPNFGQEPSIRFWGGYESCEGLGFRATYWEFEDSSGLTPLGVGGVNLGLGVDVYTVDLELTHRAKFCGFDILASGGVRIGGLKQSLFAAAQTQAGPASIAISRDFDGAGLTFGVGFDRQVGCSPLSLYGNFRGSILFGDSDIDLNVNVPPFVPLAANNAATLKNQTLPIWEIQLGLEYNRETGFGDLFARAGVEAQVWEVPPVLLGLGDDHLGFFGPTFAIGLER